MSSASAMHEEITGLRRAVVVSPHFDDGVFACGRFLARHPGSIVLTVFAGHPADPQLRTEWDARCGFESAAEALLVRRREDAAAAAALGAQTRWLRFVDSQYGTPPAQEAVASDIVRALVTLDADALMIPLGLFHTDHALVSDACVRLLQRGHLGRCIAYEDALYRRKPGLVQQRLAQLRAEHEIAATPVAPVCAVTDAEKRRAVSCYGSQLRAFGEGGYSDLFEPERYWVLENREVQHAFH